MKFSIQIRFFLLNKIWFLFLQSSGAGKVVYNCEQVAGMGIDNANRVSVFFKLQLVNFDDQKIYTEAFEVLSGFKNMMG